MKKLILGAIFGGLAMFLWGFVSPIAPGKIGQRQLPAESATPPAVGGEVDRSGLYFFPGPNPSAATGGAIEAPGGLLVHTAGGFEPMASERLAMQFGGDVLAALFGAILLWLAGMAGYLSRVVFVTLIGFAAWASINLPYWIWYGYPASLTLAAGADTTLSWLAAGLVMGLIVRPGR